MFGLFPSVASGSVICAFGELVQDQTLTLSESLALEGQIESPVVFTRGGAAPNVLAASAALGMPSRFIGHFGADPISSSLADELQRGGVRVHGIRRGRGAASVNLQMANGETALIFDPGDSRSMRPQEIRPRWMHDVAVLHLNSHHLYAEETRAVFWRVVEVAQEQEVPISLDVSTLNGLKKFGVDAYRDALARVRPAVVMANDAEADLLEVEVDFPEGVSVVIQKRRNEPTRVTMIEEESFEVPVPEAEQIVSTVGAGDAFAGGFLAGWVQNRSLRGAVELGHVAAVQSLQAYGVSTPGVIDPIAKVG